MTSDLQMLQHSTIQESAGYVVGLIVNPSQVSFHHLGLSLSNRLCLKQKINV